MLMRRIDLLRSQEAAANSQSTDATNVSDGSPVVARQEKAGISLGKGSEQCFGCLFNLWRIQRFPEESTNCPLS